MELEPWHFSLATSGSMFRTESGCTQRITCGAKDQTRVSQMQGKHPWMSLYLIPHFRKSFVPFYIHYDTFMVDTILIHLIYPSQNYNPSLPKS